MTKRDDRNPFIGVFFHPRNKKYRAKVCPRVHGERVDAWLGAWDDPRLAALLRDYAAQRIWGPEAELNFPELRGVLPDYPVIRIDAQLKKAGIKMLEFRLK